MHELFKKLIERKNGPCIKDEVSPNNLLFEIPLGPCITQRVLGLVWMRMYSSQSTCVD